MKAPSSPSSNIYLLMNSSSIVLARAALSSPPDAPNMQFQITDGRADDVVAAELVQAVPLDPQQRSRLARVILRRGNRIVLEPIRLLGDEARQNLRVPSDFESFAYPMDGGRTLIKANDLSCGGIAFYCPYPFAVHERFEIVIPITAEPLLVWCECLRVKPYMDPVNFYAAAFVDLIHDLEAKIREAVFSVQLRQKDSVLGNRQK